MCVETIFANLYVFCYFVSYLNVIFGYMIVSSRCGRVLKVISVLERQNSTTFTVMLVRCEHVDRKALLLVFKLEAVLAVI